ncbi:MAG: response regulator transcription factor [Elusimicrobiales bacterium]
MKKILVVDDDVIFRHLVKELLEDNGYEVHTAKDGVDGLEKLKIEKYDLVILDVNMPNLNGFETLSKIREDEELFDIPVIMLTVKAMVNDQIQGFEYGADEYLTKPFENDILLAKVKALLEKE